MENLFQFLNPRHFVLYFGVLRQTIIKTTIVGTDLQFKQLVSLRAGGKVKVKVTLVQALRLCTGCTVHRGSRGVALLFHDQRHQKGVRGQRHSPAALYPRERPGTHCTGSWVGPRAGLDRCGKSRTHRDSIPGPSNTQPVTILTELPGPHRAEGCSVITGVTNALFASRN